MASNKEFVKNCIENLKQHLKLNYSNLSNLKVFQDIGEYPFVIKFTQFNDYDLNLTLQINNDHNLSNSIIVLSQTKQNKYSDNKLKSLEETLLSKLAEIDSNNQIFLIKFFDKALEYVENNFEKNQPENMNQKLKKSKEIKQSKLNTSSEQTNDLEIKKCSMKTASDVVHRIQWDEEINKDFIIVGYMDRFLGLKECLFNTFDWGDIVLADLGALAIPEHRINYFKYKNEIIWDKKSRLDNIFGSTGSDITIRDVIKRLENQYYEAKIEELEEQNKLGRVQEKVESNDNPNYFISIPIKSAELQSNLYDLTCDLLDSNSDVLKYLVPDTSYHLTLCTLRIDSNEQMKIVKDVMKSFELNEEVLKENFPINLNFKGVDQFYDKVFYLKFTNDQLEKLKNLKKYILNEFEKFSVNLAGNYYEFVPHLTVFKIKNSNCVVRDLVDQFLWKKYSDFNFGIQKVKEIELCKMVDIYNCKTYPVEFSIKID